MHFTFSSFATTVVILDYLAPILPEKGAWPHRLRGATVYKLLAAVVIHSAPGGAWLLVVTHQKTTLHSLSSSFPSVSLAGRAVVDTQLPYYSHVSTKKAATDSQTNCPKATFCCRSTTRSAGGPPLTRPPSVLHRSTAHPLPVLWPPIWSSMATHHFLAIQICHAASLLLIYSFRHSATCQYFSYHLPAFVELLC